MEDGILPPNAYSEKWFTSEVTRGMMKDALVEISIRFLNEPEETATFEQLWLTVSVPSCAFQRAQRSAAVLLQIKRNHE